VDDSVLMREVPHQVVKRMLALEFIRYFGVLLQLLQEEEERLYAAQPCTCPYDYRYPLG
jgi:hypothetical protein